MLLGCGSDSIDSDENAQNDPDGFAAPEQSAGGIQRFPDQECEEEQWFDNVTGMCRECPAPELTCESLGTSSVNPVLNTIEVGFKDGTVDVLSATIFAEARWRDCEAPDGNSTSCSRTELRRLHAMATTTDNRLSFKLDVPREADTVSIERLRIFDSCGVGSEFSVSSGWRDNDSSAPPLKCEFKYLSSF